MRANAWRPIPMLMLLPLFAGISPANGAPVTRMWDVVQTPQWDLMVRSVERVADPVVAADGTSVRPHGRFAVFVIDLTNRTAAPLAPAAADFALTAPHVPTPRDLTTSPLARTLEAERDAIPFGTPIAPGETARTVLVYDIPTETALGTLTLHFRPAIARPIVIDECHCNLPSPTGNE